MKKVVIAMYALLAIVALAIPASAQEDTAPPQTQSLSLSTNVIDTSVASQVVTATATITDNLSGVVAYSVYVSLDPPSGSASVYGYLTLQSGDTYAGDINFPQYSAEGIWTIQSVSSRDNAGNSGFETNADLLQRGINVAIGNGSFESSYGRQVIRLDFGRRSLIGKCESDSRACESSARVLLQRKRPSEWRTIRETWVEWRKRFDFRHVPLREGRYRVVIPVLGLGTPVLTNCGRASQGFKVT